MTSHSGENTYGVCKTFKGMAAPVSLRYSGYFEREENNILHLQCVNQTKKLHINITILIEKAYFWIHSWQVGAFMNQSFYHIFLSIAHSLKKRRFSLKKCLIDLKYHFGMHFKSLHSFSVNYICLDNNKNA